ncbi:hypothetical protein E2605_14870 [Dysgonomonas capnocytophagoides]|uniref:Uncharacterized protein n=1 Tax=Dysgonomonas capnocytophagoides TaxID=45254 RepID=A0A4Y8L1Q4_9BACT|nr:hypothetical protein [Dysgonomonas capnocytophagoides]TFD94652.1 hypothetical protein E2605_14870 [Dysgonomonas capnocytophagoides]
MKKDVAFLNSYLRDNYFSLQEEVKKVYYFDLDTFHDCILDLYDCIAIGRKLNRKEIKQSILNAYRKFRNKGISDSFKEKSHEDNVLDFLDNKTNTDLYNTACNNIKSTARIILSKNDYLILDFYFFQRKSKNSISIFMGEDIDFINRRLDKIKDNLYKKLNYENHD